MVSESGRLRLLSGRTSCAEDQVVIEMLRELDSDIWETIASCFQFRLMNHWTEETDKSWNTQLVTMVKKKSGKLTMRGFRPIAMLPTIYLFYSNWRDMHVPGRQAHEVVWMLRMVEQATEWQIPVFVIDNDVARLTPRNHESNVSHGCPPGAD